MTTGCHVSLQHAKKQRETVGVELYGYQQNLAKLQLALEKTQDNYQAISRIRVQVCPVALANLHCILPCQITSLYSSWFRPPV